MQVVSSLIAAHFALVFWMIASGTSGRQLIVQGALLRGGMLDEPWRLLTSLLIHIGPLHVFWNGASMMVFAVPLITDLRYARTGMVYLASGIGGSIMALSFATPGTLIAGSSGSVAGLFGAWVVLQTRRDRLAQLTGRARIRTMGIAMLVLPSLVTPISVTGNPVSVSSHPGSYPVCIEFCEDFIVIKITSELFQCERSSSCICCYFGCE
ncbi:MAG: rhomboid family intramembrane serine protease [Planctomycetes bacterium]|nr:rhomboid family intramembrane serine protease [Planctomycetota bacterium]